MKKEKGFTLIELLIVIVVIGVLSAMMMLSSTEAVSSSKASNIISNLRSLKTAVTSWYADNLNRITASSGGASGEYLIKSANNGNKNLEGFISYDDAKAEILKYLNKNDGSIYLAGYDQRKAGRYTLGVAKSYKRAGVWYVGYQFGASDSRVKEKVAAKAASLGLLEGKSGNSEQPFSTQYGGTADIVWMHILTLGEYKE